ncbi:MAG: hypothetical protein QOG68_2425 [Solirubrobacteraceae bacterium]|nr:hypothetical protein [Solirubrobacteraceae bacterium]
MSPLRESLARLFVEPAPAPLADAEPSPADAVRWLPPAEGGRPTAIDPARPLAVGVVCSPRDAWLAGAGAALALLARGPAPTAVVLEWTGDPAREGQDRPATLAARRCAAELVAGGHRARPVGRLVRTSLPAADDEAAAMAQAIAVATRAATVLVVAGARGGVIEAELARRDLVLLISRPDADADLASLAAADLARAGASPVAVTLVSSPGAALLARSGTGLVAPLRAPLLAGLGLDH